MQSRSLKERTAIASLMQFVSQDTGTSERSMSSSDFRLPTQRSYMLQHNWTTDELNDSMKQRKVI